MSNFAQLHIHTEYSYLDGLCKISDLVNRAKEIGMQALGIADHMNINGVLEFQEVCKNVDIQPVIGCECYIVENMDIKEKGELRQHICFYVMKETGWKNLNKILTKASIDGFYYKPRIDYKYVLDNCKGLIVTTACSNSFLNLLEGREFFKELIENHADNTYIELMPLEYERQYTYHKRLLRFSRQCPGVKFIASNDCHYINKEDANIHDILLAINSKTTLSNPDRWQFDVKDLFLKSEDEMLQSFDVQNIIPESLWTEAMSNTMEIVEKCSDFSIEKKKIFLPRVYDEDEKELITKLCKSKLRRLGLAGSLKYIQRMEEEVDVLDECGFIRYFLIVHELVAWCKEKDILIGPGRGSVSGSLVAYLLEITQIDPFKYDLIFERFIDKTRVKYPDIDMDFEDVKRGMIRSHFEELYGKYAVASLSTYTRMKDKMVFRDVCRVHDIPIMQINRYSKLIEEDLETFIEKTYEGNNFTRKYPEIINAARKLLGQIRNLGQHAAGIVIANKDLRDGDYGNLVKAKDSFAINWTKENVMNFGLLKLDILGLSTLSILRKALEHIKKTKNKDIDFSDINFNDERVLKKFTKGESVGCFQFSSYGMRKLCGDINIDSFNSLVDVVALYRPAPLKLGLVETYIKNKREGNVIDLEPRLDKILNSTFGVIVFQEQVMQIAHDFAGLSLFIANKLRLALDHQDEEELSEIKKQFYESCRERGIIDSTIRKVWRIVNKYREYGFCKAHAVGYTLIAYYSMYLKVHFPAAFFVGALSHIASDKKEELLLDASKSRLKISIPKIGISKSKTWVEREKTLYMPFSEIKGVGEKMAETLENVGGNNESFFQDIKGIGAKTIEMLKLAGVIENNNISLSKSYDYGRGLQSKFKI